MTADNPWTDLLHAADSQVEGAKERLFAALYSELRGLAQRQLQRSAALTISPTTLLHEAYLDIAGGGAVFPDRARFMGYAARVMRGLVIDFVRQRQAQKRGAGYQFTQIDSKIMDGSADPRAEDAELQRLSAALDELATREPRLAEVVDLRYFCGFTLAEIANMRGASERTVQRDWEKARLILFRRLEDESAG